MKKLFRVTKFYHYAEMYDVEAETEKEAKDLVETGEYGEEDDIYKEFDFYEVQEITE
jgi:hypothetical protein